MINKAFTFFLFFLAIPIAVLALDECALTLLSSSADHATYQLCVNLENPIKLDISSVSFETDDSATSITGWRVISGARHAEIPHQKTIAFEVDCAPTKPVAGSYMHLYFLELNSQAPHHYAVPVLQNTSVTQAPAYITQPCNPNQTDFSLNKKAFGRHVINVLKTPITLIQKLSELVLRFLDVILSSHLLLLLLLTLLGFFLGLLPFFFSAELVLIFLVHKQQTFSSRALSAGIFIVGFLLAVFTQLYRYTNCHHAIAPGVALSLCVTLGFVYLGIVLLKRVRAIPFKIPLLINAPIGLAIGLVSIALMLNVLTVLTPQTAEALNFIAQHGGMIFLVIGLGLYFYAFELFAPAFIGRIRNTPWFSELITFSGFIFILHAIAILSFVFNLYAITFLFCSCLGVLSLWYAWRATAQTTNGIRKFRIIISLFFVGSAVLIIAKTAILTFC